MAIAVSLLLIAAGAVLRWAHVVTQRPTLGLILMAVGLVGLIAALAHGWLSRTRLTTADAEHRSLLHRRQDRVAH